MKPRLNEFTLDVSKTGTTINLKDMGPVFCRVIEYVGQPYIEWDKWRMAGVRIKPGYKVFLIKKVEDGDGDREYQDLFQYLDITDPFHDRIIMLDTGAGLLNPSWL